MPFFDKRKFERIGNALRQKRLDNGDYIFLLRYAAYVLGKYQLPEDMLDEIFQKAIVKMITRKDKKPPGDWRAYFSIVLKTTWADYLKKLRREPVFDPSVITEMASGDTDPPAIPVERTWEAIVEYLVKCLSEMGQGNETKVNVLYEVHVLGRSQKKFAEEHDTTAPNINYHYKTALKEFRPVLKKIGEQYGESFLGDLFHEALIRYREARV